MYAIRSYYVESGKRFKNIFAKSKTVMLIIDPVTKLIVEANESAVKFYGYSATELEGMSIKKINKIDPDVMDKEMKNAMKDVITSYSIHYTKLYEVVYMLQVIRPENWIP